MKVKTRKPQRPRTARFSKKDIVKRRKKQRHLKTKREARVVRESLFEFKF